MKPKIKTKTVRFSPQQVSDNIQTMPVGKDISAGLRDRRESWSSETRSWGVQTLVNHGGSSCFSLASFSSVNSVTVETFSCFYTDESSRGFWFGSGSGSGFCDSPPDGLVCLQFKPLEQLMGVFPAASGNFLPPTWRNLMSSPVSLRRSGLGG